MQKWLLIVLLMVSQAAVGQHGMIFVKKRGLKKVATFVEGAPIVFHKKDGSIVNGVLALVRNDSLYVNGYSHHISTVSRIIIRPKNQSIVPDLLLTTAGVGIATAGITLAKWKDFKGALLYSSGMGYGQLLIKNVSRLSRKQYRIGRKFRLQTLDLHFRRPAAV
ncbi:MAG TPA: hypothetical protein VFR58_09990 [Flavisolibacter sp.]|nr:hypothetical protein [Flavisolibacter sp.]